MLRRILFVGCFFFLAPAATLIAQQRPAPTESELVATTVQVVLDGMNDEPYEVFSRDIGVKSKIVSLEATGKRFAHVDANQLHVYDIQQDKHVTWSVDIPAENLRKLHWIPETNNLLLIGEDRIRVVAADSGEVVLSNKRRTDKDRVLDWSICANGLSASGISDSGKFFDMDLQKYLVVTRGLAIDNPIERGILAIFDDPSKRVIGLYPERGKGLHLLDKRQGKSLRISPWTRDTKIVAGKSFFAVANRFDLKIVSFDISSGVQLPGAFSPQSIQLTTGQPIESVLAAGKSFLTERIAIMRVSAPYKSERLWFLPDDDARSICWDASGRRVLYRTGTTVRVFETPEVSYRLGQGQMNPILKGIETEKRYSVLESVCKKLLVADKVKTKRPYSHFLKLLARYFEEYETLEGATDSLPVFYQQWLTEFPESVTARNLASEWYKRLAWAERGDGFVGQIPREQLDAFTENLEIAEKYLGDLAVDDVSPELLTFALETAQGLSWPWEKRVPIIERMKKDYPTHNWGHSVVAVSLLPRWGGEAGDSEKYIQEVSDSLGGEAGDRLYAQLAADLVRFFPIRSIFDSLSLDVDRVTRGLLLTRPEQDVSVNGYCCVIAWHFAEGHEDVTYQLVRNLEKWTVVYPSPLDQPAELQNLIGKMKALEMKKKRVEKP